MKWKFVALVASLTVLLSASGYVFALDSPEGEWWVVLKKGDKGKLALQFGDPSAGSFSVQGYGFTYNQTATFVTIPSGQALQMDSAGRVTGALELQNSSGVAIGSLEITGGSINVSNFKTFNLVGVLTLTGVGSTVDVKLSGSRMPDSTEGSTIYTGRTIRGKVKGKGVKSKTYDFTVDNEQTLGEPFFTLSGDGPVSVDGVDTVVSVDAVLVRDPFSEEGDANTIGTFTSAEIGDGTVTGSLFVNKEDLRKANLKLSTDERKLTVSGTLDIAVNPIISVTTNDSLNVGEVTVGNTEDLTFTVTNTGVGTLTGEVEIDGEGFHISTSDPTYSLDADEKTTIVIVFKPLSAKSYSATVTFSGGGGATVTLTGTGKSSS